MQKIKNVVKNNSIFGFIYLIFIKTVLFFLQLFVPIKTNKILFTSFSGRQVSDSPYIIYLQLKEDPKFKNYEFLWGVNDPDEFDMVPRNEKIKMDSFKYWKALLESKFWISNSSIERLVATKHTGHVYINTWHGIPLKHLGPDEKHLDFLVRNWFKNVSFDLLYCCGEYDKEIFHHIFPSTNNIQKLGLPRNIELKIKSDFKEKNYLFKKFNIDKNKKTILYAPTFREYNIDHGENGFAFPFSKNTLEALSYEYNFLVRDHYFVEKLTMDDSVKKFMVDVSDFEDINQLFKLADIVVTDYSSLIFDFSLLNKNIVLYMNDIDEYSKYRGFYLDPRQLGLPAAYTEKELIEQIDISDGFETNKAVTKLNNSFNENLDVDSSYLKRYITDRS